MGELADEEKLLEKLPEWVPTYLAAWGSTRPDGKAMSVEWAAGLAGVSPSAVRKLRIRQRQFQTLEYIARHGGSAFMASYADAGIRGAAPGILMAFLKLVEEGNSTVVLQGMKWLLNKPDADVLNNVGLVWLAKNDTPAAVSFFQKAAAASPTHIVGASCTATSSPPT